MKEEKEKRRQEIGGEGNLINEWVERKQKRGKINEIFWQKRNIFQKRRFFHS